MSNQTVTQMATLYAQSAQATPSHTKPDAIYANLCPSCNSILRLRGASLHVTQVLMIFFSANNLKVAMFLDFLCKATGTDTVVSCLELLIISRTGAGNDSTGVGCIVPSRF